MVDTRLLSRINLLEMQLQQYGRDVSGSERIALETAQARADSVAALFGQSAPPPIAGEDPITYRKRLASSFQKYSPQLQDSRLIKALDAGSFALCEAKIYADAAEAARTAPTQPGTLRAIEERDRAGRLITRYVGDISAFMAPFASSGVAAQINRKP